MKKLPPADAPVVVTIRHDLTRTTFAVLFMVGLIAGCFWIMRPFIAATIWATMIVVATWSMMESLEARLWNRRWLAVIGMTLALVLAFVIPFLLAIRTIVANADEIAGWLAELGTLRLPELPVWIQHLPLAGPKITAHWYEIRSAAAEEIAARLEPYARNIVGWFVLEVGSFGMMALQLLLTLIIAAILYARGERAAAGLRAFFRRIGGSRGEEILELSGQAIRGVAFGVVVTALVQSLMGAIGLAVSGVPFVGLLTAMMFILAVAQIGAAPVLFAVVLWMYWVGSTGWATGLLVWAIIVSSMDNILRPLLIQRGGRLPLLLVLAGVIGGLVAFGLVGIFVGPLALAVSYRLLEAWVNEGLS